MKIRSSMCFPHAKYVIDLLKLPFICLMSSFTCPSQDIADIPSTWNYYNIILLLFKNNFQPLKDQSLYICNKSSAEMF